MSSCEDLHVCHDGAGNQGTWISEWRPTLGERIRIILGGHLWLIVAGFNQPPVSITAESPFEVMP